MSKTRSKLSANQKKFAFILAILLPLILFFQRYTQVKPEDVKVISSSLVKYDLKKHRQYRLQIQVNGQEDNFVCDPVIYPAFKKYGFKDFNKKNDKIEIGIHKNDFALLNNGNKDVINLIKISGISKKGLISNYLLQKDYNLYRSMSFIKFYIAWGMGLLILLYLIFFNKKTNTEEAT